MSVHEGDRVFDEAPAELYNADWELEYVKNDVSRGQARGRFSDESGTPFSDVVVRRVYMAFDRRYAEEQATDGVPEPYDGWPWSECPVDHPEAVPYWHKVSD